MPSNTLKELNSHTWNKFTTEPEKFMKWPAKRITQFIKSLTINFACFSRFFPKIFSSFPTKSETKILLHLMKQISWTYSNKLLLKKPLHPTFKHLVKIKNRWLKCNWCSNFLNFSIVNWEKLIFSVCGILLTKPFTIWTFKRPIFTGERKAKEQQNSRSK